MEFKKITQEELDGIGEPIYYGSGRIVCAGDEVIFGYTNMYSNLNGTPPSRFNSVDEIGLSFHMFVLYGEQIYQTYRLNK